MFGIQRKPFQLIICTNCFHHEQITPITKVPPITQNLILRSNSVALKTYRDTSTYIYCIVGLLHGYNDSQQNIKATLKLVRHHIRNICMKNYLREDIIVQYALIQSSSLFHLTYVQGYHVHREIWTPAVMYEQLLCE